MDTSKLSKVSILLTTFLLAVPFAPTALGTSLPNVSVALDNPSQIPGGSITATVSLSPISNLAAYELNLVYNPDVLTATSATYSRTVFDGLPTIGPPSPRILPQGGVVRVEFTGLSPAGVIATGGGVSTTASTPLLFVHFMVNNPPGQSASELPAAVMVQIPELSICDPSAISVCPDTHLVIPTTMGAVYSPPASIFLRSVGCRSTLPGFNTHAKGFTDSMFCRVVNSGTGTFFAGASFTWTSLNGVTGSSSTPSVVMAPGQTAELTASITVPNAVDVFTVTGTVGYGFPDGTVYSTVPSTQSLTFNIFVCTASC